ncbi:alpha-amylase 1-like [Ptychodera flava]|uniref:alpha-amylase 1-like n=1 Tax=Ptychodera flava TaxID=63121 RepID=UPI00396A989A
MALIFTLVCLSVVHCATAQWNTNMADNRQAIVQLFGWKWNDIASECENFLSGAGYGAVQISPPNEHPTVWSPWRPWWERYQPVSYKLTSRSGSEDELRSMVQRCNAVGVRIYVDAVINHMTGGGTDYGTAGSWFDTGARSFPGVPYSSYDFNDWRCDKNIENYNDANEVRNCRLTGLVDLDHSSSWVQGKIVEYMNTLIDMGVAGFRVDACKHMWPGDVDSMFSSLNNLPSDTFGSGARAFIYLEVIDQGGEAVKATDYTYIGYVTEFKYGIELGNCFHGNNQLKWLSSFGQAWGLLASGSALVFIDNHDNQRGHGGGGNILSHKEPKQYKMANAFMLAWPYGVSKVMSSYSFYDSDAGPPANGDGSIKDVECFDGDWVCEHRWRQISEMVNFRKLAAGTSVENWWDNGSNQIAFSRGNVGFIAINGDSWDLSDTIYTGLPAGTYCNLYTSDYTSKSCTNKDGGMTTVTVGWDGNAYIYVPSNDNPVLAIHTSAML